MNPQGLSKPVMGLLYLYYTAFEHVLTLFMMNRIPFTIVTRLVPVGSYFLVNPQAHNEMFLDGEWTCICICCEMCQNTRETQ